MVRARFAAACLAVACWLGSGGLQAQEAESFPRVYAWETPPQGWLELTLWETVITHSKLPYRHFGLTTDRARLWAQSLEAEYGLTDQFSVAVYGDFEKPDDHALAFSRGRVEARYRLFGRRQRLVDPALYVEYYFPRAKYDAPEQLEARLILERDIGDFRVGVNPVFGKALSGEEVKERTYLGVAAGTYYRRLWRLQPGLELFWNTGQLGSTPPVSRHWVILSPSIDLNLHQSLSWHVAAGIGLTDGSDRFLVRSYLTYQFETVRPSSQQQE